METAIKEIDKENAHTLMNVQRKMSKIFTKTQELENSPLDFFTQQELALDVGILRSTWLSIPDNQRYFPPNTFASLENVYTSGISGTKKGLDVVKAFYDLINESVFVGLINWISAYIYIYI